MKAAPLWHAAGPGSRQNQDGLLAIGTDKWPGQIGQRLVRPRKIVAAQLWQPTQFSGKLACPSQMRGIAQQQSGLTIAKHQVQFAQGQTPVERNQDRSQQCAGKEGIQVLRKIVGQDCHPRTLTNAVLPIQDCGQSPGSLVERPVRQIRSTLRIDQPDLCRC